ncbi:GIY-YIG nuclease family protein [Aliisedimentitalea scapharcae]|uniref:GIY-YIG nuclease family protein n=1 Tax=Aliisedimentitalea scapharcae TaxID=1524259 RepID=A0ABZ2XRM4_9RHOB
MTGQGDRRNWTYLLKRGFTYGADWQIGASGQLTVDKALPDLPGVYALIVDEDIVYIGVTARTLSKRMADYARGPKAQRTSHRVHHLLKTALGGGRVSRVLYAMPEHTDWNGLPVQTAPGLEQGLIQHIKPIWNLQGA